MWWHYDFGSESGLFSNEIITALGTGGQVIMIIPEAEIVFVHRGDTDNNRHVDDGKIWKLVEMLYDAKSGEASSHPKLQALTAMPYENALPAPEIRTEIELSSEVLERYLGNYELSSGVSISVKRYGKVLSVLFPGVGESDFFPESEKEFFAKAVNAEILFVENTKGEIERLVVYFRGRTTEATRKK